MLAVFVEIPLSQVFELIHAHLETTGAAKALEERGAYFGQIFALLALIQSGRLNEKVNSISFRSHTACYCHSFPQADILQVLRRLTQCSQKKTYLQEFCATAVCRLLEVCPAETVHKHMIPILGLEGGWEKITPETLLQLLHLEQRHSKVDSSIVPPFPLLKSH